MSTTKDITVREFIKEYLIDQIGEIKEKYPYLAFLLMSVGIEFLGKCQSSDDWNANKSNSKQDFGKGLNIKPLDVYKNLDLYKNLRCGLAHSLLTKGQLALSNKGEKSAINCDEFYEKFKEACEQVINGKKDENKKIYINGNIEIKKDLDDIFFTITQTQNATNGTVSSVTSTTQINQSKTTI